MAIRDEHTRSLLRRLLDEMDHAQGEYEGPERRRETRLAYRRITPPTRMAQVTGDVLNVATITRNLSPLGVGLLHRPYVYSGSSLVLTLQKVTGEPVHLVGEVLNCHYAGESYHESSVRFEARIELKDFLTEAQRGRAAKHLDQVRRRLDGVRMLLIDPTGAVMKRMGHSFRALGANVVSVEFLGRALDHVRTNPVDLLFCGPAHDGADAAQIVKLSRAAGYVRPIIAIGWSNADLAAARKVEDAGVIASLESSSAMDVMKVIGTLDPKPETREKAA
ncbi:MAG: hypothetical protein ACF8Q5_05390 [Phycisphaerales bacterium JB040]